MRGRDARRAEKAGERFSVSCESRILETGWLAGCWKLAVRRRREKNLPSGADLTSVTQCSSSVVC